MKNKEGFTLFEILIALFIFTIVSMILAGSLRNMMDSLSVTESKADRLRRLQIALLIMSRDIEQTINRPVINQSGKTDFAFIGAARGFAFTHTGFANPTHALARSTMQRAAYQWSEDTLQRMTWAVLDQPPKSQPHSRALLSDVVEAHFEYLDKNGKFYKEWPLKGQEAQQPLPRAVRVYLTLANWGTLTQLYPIPAEASKAAQGAPPQPGPASGTEKKVESK